MSFNQDGEKVGCVCVDESMGKSFIYNLRAAIFQIYDENDDLKNIKKRMEQILKDFEKKLLEDFLTSEFGCRKI